MLDAYMEVGKIAGKVRDEFKKKIKEGVSLLEIAEDAENRIIELGAKPAFPVNISINDVAAHYTPFPNDKKCFKAGDVVKFDIGAHIDGIIADTAVTVEVGSKRYEKMIECSEKALENAINVIRDGVSISKIGEVIEETVKNAGYLPISDLSGHVISKYRLHTGISIPNIKVKEDTRLKDGNVVAIEPFVTDGSGRVKAEKEYSIFSLIRDAPQRSPSARRLLEFIAKEYGFLPFAERWVYRTFGGRAQLALRTLLLNGAIRRYDVLREEKGGIVAQSEHTMIVCDDKAVVTTR